MIESVRVVGARGRVGAAVSARLAERGAAPRRRRAGRSSSCASPTGRSPSVARARHRAPGSRTSPARRRSRRSTRTRAASACTRCRRSPTRRGPEQLDGAWAAVTAETDEARAVATWLGRDPRPAPVPARRRRDGPLYHAGAAIASNYLVTLRRAAGSLLEAAGAPPEALDPLMRRVIENDFELTGPIERGDWDDRRAAPGRRSARAAPSSRSVLAAGGAHGPADRRTRCRREDVPHDRGAARRARPRRAGLDRARAHDGRAARRAPLAPRAPRGASATRS